MKKLIVAAFSIIGFLSLQSCKTDFAIAAPYKPYTIVYGILSQSDTAHYIRIQKAFLDDTKSALVMSKVADSNYWPNLDVVIKQIKNNVVINTFNLTKVDMAIEGYTKKPGDSSNFFSAPNYAYKFKSALDETSTYRLVITNPDSKEVDSSETPIVNTNFYVREMNSATTTINFTPIDQFSFVRLQGNMPNHANVAEGYIRFHYVDKVITTGAETERYIDVKLPEAEMPGFILNQNSNFEFKLSNPSILNHFATQIPDADNNLARYLDSATIVMYTGGVVLNEYISIARTQGSGLTSDQIQTKYTNMKGKNVLGIFSTRAYRARANVPVNEVSLNALKTNPLTVNKNFQGRSDH